MISDLVGRRWRPIPDPARGHAMVDLFLKKGQTTPVSMSSWTEIIDEGDIETAKTCGCIGGFKHLRSLRSYKGVRPLRGK